MQAHILTTNLDIGIDGLFVDTRDIAKNEYEFNHAEVINTFLATSRIHLGLDNMRDDKQEEKV